MIKEAQVVAMHVADTKHQISCHSRGDEGKLVYKATDGSPDWERSTDTEARALQRGPQPDIK